MSVRVADTRTVYARANSPEAVGTTPGWFGAGGSLATNTFVEGPTAYVGTLNIATGQLYYEVSAGINLRDTLIYVWSNNFALQDVWTATNPPNAMYIADGTNLISIRIAGSNKKVFSHLTDQDWNWDCLLIDTVLTSSLNSQGRIVTRGGNFANLNLGSITRLGSDQTTLSKGLGGGTNVAVDIIRYGNNGIRISSGSSADPGKLTQIVEKDRATSTDSAFGVLREYTTGLFGCQSPLNFGTSSENSWFQDSNVTLTFEDRDVNNDKYYLRVTGSSSPSFREVFILDNCAISTAGPHVRLDFSSNRIATLTITNCTFRNLSSSVTFASDNTASLFHTVNDNVFGRSGRLAINSVNFNSNTVQNSDQVSILSGSMLNCNILTSLVGANSGALYWNTSLAPLGTLDGTVFARASGSQNHAIEFGPNCPSTMSFNNLTFTNYGPSGSASASIYNTSGKALLINIVSGLTPTARTAGGGVTFIAGLTQVTLTGMVSASEVRVLDSTTGADIAGIEDVGATGTFAFSHTAGEFVDIVIHAIEYEYILIEDFEIPATNATLPISQIFDRNYKNP